MNGINVENSTHEEVVSLTWGRGSIFVLLSSKYFFLLSYIYLKVFIDPILELKRSMCVSYLQHTQNRKVFTSAEENTLDFFHFKFEGIDIQEAFDLLHCLEGHLRTKSRLYQISLPGLCTP